MGLPFAGHVPESVTAAEASDAGQRSFEHQMGIFRACSTIEAQLRAEAQDRLAKSNAAALVALVESQYQPRVMIESFDEAKARSLFQRLAANGTWQTPTLIVTQAAGRLNDKTLLDDPRLKYISRSQREA